jgi:hypothetical protein
MIKEGGAYSATIKGEMHSVIIERNDKQRLSYFKYVEKRDEYKYIEVLKPSNLAEQHLSYIKSIKGWQHG